MGDPQRQGLSEGLDEAGKSPGPIKSEAALTSFLLFSILPHLEQRHDTKGHTESIFQQQNLYFFFFPIQLPKVLPPTSHQGDHL